MLLPSAQLLIFVGTYTSKGGASQGIYSVRLDPTTGAFTSPEVAAETPRPTFLAWHPNGRVLYALGDGPAPDGNTTPGAVAFNFDARTGKLAQLNARGTGGGNTTHLAPDATGRVLVTVSYSGGQIAAFPLAADGTIGARAAFIAHAGPPGPNKARQDQPHPHSVTFSPDNRFAYVCDLGLDKVFCYAADTTTGTLTARDSFVVPPGAGPRHSKFSTDGRFFYVVNELGGSVTAFACDPATGRLTRRQTISTLPGGFTGQNISAEIRVHPNGKFVYASNRGHDSIAVFTSQADGTLQLVAITPCGGQHPRNFALSPDGCWLVCANMESNNLVSFRVDAGTGRLTPAGHTVPVPQAVCVLFAPSAADN